MTHEWKSESTDQHGTLKKHLTCHLEPYYSYHHWQKYNYSIQDIEQVLNHMHIELLYILCIIYDVKRSLSDFRFDSLSDPFTLMNIKLTSVAKQRIIHLISYTCQIALGLPATSKSHVWKDIHYNVMLPCVFISPQEWKHVYQQSRTDPFQIHQLITHYLWEDPTYGPAVPVRVDNQHIYMQRVTDKPSPHQTTPTPYQPCTEYNGKRYFLTSDQFILQCAS
jgi:hypothetical protein